MQFAHIHQAAKRFANNYLAYNKRNMCETKVMVIILDACMEVSRCGQARKATLETRASNNANSANIDDRLVTYTNLPLS